MLIQSRTESFEIKESLENDQQAIIPPETYFFVKVFLIKNGKRPLGFLGTHSVHVSNYLLFVEADELTEIRELKSKNLEKYFKKNKLAANPEIKQFLKIRLTVLLRSYGKRETKEPETTNELFIKRLLDSEIQLIQQTIDSLN